MVTPDLKILSCDDDENIRAFLYSLLTEHGYDIEFARDSNEVFKNLGRAKYDLLILDVNTPGLNGYKVAEKISENIINRPRILIFTARNIEDERLQFVTCGADAILRKGAPCDRILGTIAELFSKGVNSPMQENPRREEPRKPEEQIAKDLQYCISRVTQVEDSITLKNLRYEEFIRDLLREKQRTEKNYLEFKRIETEVMKMKNWGYAVAALSVMAIMRAFF
ncbi:MAG TPA: hypothetical protein DEQ38_11650 [Elusimicrobia bacterium]|nr:hypothetical protein [Elusimicrobiota bacterium]